MADPTSTSDYVVQLTQRLHVFFSHLDERRYDALTAMFLPEGRWLRQGRWIEGRVAILQAMQARPASTRVRHIISNVLVTPKDADEMQVEAYITAYRQVEGQKPHLFSINLVSNTFRRRTGEWMLAEQQLIRDFEFEAA